MTGRSKYYYALVEDWPEVLTALEEALDVEYVDAQIRKDWGNDRYQTWRDLPLRKPQSNELWKQFYIMTPSGQPIEMPYSQDLMDEQSAAGAKDPQADWRPITIPHSAVPVPQSSGR